MPLLAYPKDKDYIPTERRLRTIYRGLEQEWLVFKRRWEEWSKWLDPYGFRPHDISNYSFQDKAWEGRGTINPRPSELARIFAAGASTLISNKATKWARVRPEESFYYGETDYDHFVLGYTYGMSKEMLSSLAATNVYKVLFRCYQDLAIYGCMGFMGRRDPVTVSTFKHYAPGSYMVSLNEKDEVISFYCKASMTAVQIRDRYGKTADGKFMKESLPDTIVQALNRKSEYDRNFDVETLIIQNPNKMVGEEGLAGANFIEAHYLGKKYDRAGTENGETYLEGTKWAGEDSLSGPRKGAAGNLLEYQGHHSMPFFYATWDRVENDSYGHGHPADMALKIVKGLQHAEAQSATAGDYLIMPPGLAHSSLKLPGRRITDVQPGDMVQTSSLDALKAGVSPLFQTGFRMDHAELKIGRYKKVCEESFFVDLILKVIGLEKSNVTATEINQIVGERLLVLVPLLARLEGMLKNLCEFQIDNLFEAGRLSDPPPELLDESRTALKLKVVFESILAKQQQFAQVDKLDRFMDMIGKHGAYFPNLPLLVNEPKVGHRIAEGFGVEPDALKTEEAFNEALAAREEQMQAQEQAEMAVQGGKALKELSQAGVSPEALQGGEVA